jgi:DHA2 family methylenomycin A resistance protein-like MFS transporter
LQWIIYAYTLPAVSLVLVGGLLGNIYGRKGVFLGGLITFAIASVICSLAPNLNILIAGRFLQGVGAAAFIPNSLFILDKTFGKPKQKTTAIIIWAVVSILALVTSRDFGKLITDILGWRSLFLINLVLVAISIWLTFRFVKEVVNPNKQKLNLPSLVLSIILLTGLTYILAHDRVLRSPLVLWLLTV